MAPSVAGAWLGSGVIIWSSWVNLITLRLCPLAI